MVGSKFGSDAARQAWEDYRVISGVLDVMPSDSSTDLHARLAILDEDEVSGILSTCGSGRGIWETRRFVSRFIEKNEDGNHQKDHALQIADLKRRCLLDYVGIVHSLAAESRKLRSVHPAAAPGGMSSRPA
ncbi:hypothetical protein G6L37_03205 [Agrobacterium rubi]|nr:hypothetical protein [Agrobacterium rubi]NTF24383.1 hypothetical protein [Agrobacterium rubi]